MSSDSRAIRNYLLRHPRPKLVRVDSGTRKDTVICIAGQTLSAVADSIAALNPRTLQCLNGEGHVIRASQLPLAPEQGHTEEVRLQRVEQRMFSLETQFADLFGLLVSANVRIRELVDERTQRARLEPGVHRLVKTQRRRKPNPESDGCLMGRSVFQRCISCGGTGGSHLLGCVLED